MESAENKNNEIEFERLSNENSTFKINIKLTPTNNILINCKNVSAIPNLIYEKSFSLEELKNFENFKESNSISEIFEIFKKVINIKVEKNIVEKEKKILLKFNQEDEKISIEFEILQIDRPSEEVVKELIETIKDFKEKNDITEKKISYFEEIQLKMENRINELINEIKNLKLENFEIQKLLNERNQTKDFSLSGINIKKEVKYSDYIFCLATLNDNRIASGCRDGLINIYKKNYDLDFQIKEHSGRVFYLFTHSNGNLISCSYDKTIKVFSFLDDDDHNYKCIQTITNHRSAVFKVIEIHEEKILSISADKTIKIFNKENNDEFTYEKTIKCNDISEDVVLCLDKEIATASHSESIHFFNYEFGEEENNSPIMEIKITGWNNVLKVLNENLFVCGFGGIYLINLNTKDIVKKYEFTDKLSNFEDLKFCLITNIKNKFIFGDNEGGLMLCEFNEKTKKLTYNEYKKMHESWIRTLLLRKEDIFITAGNDCKMKIWK